MAAYRIIQETLTNIVRHAEAKQVSVVIGRLADHLHLAVEDDGKGFDVEGLMASPEISQRLGLLGMHERIAQLKGVLSIESTPGKGTAVLARIPLNRDERSMDNEEAPRFSGR
jgi:signal transduction histidine kinase